jgi:hypothetical protein
LTFTASAHAMLLVWAFLLAQWGLTLLSLRLQSTRTATSFPLWPAVIALHLQLHSNNPWRDADWLAALIPILLSAVSEMLFRKAYADRLAALQADPAPPREAPSVSYRYKLVSLHTLSACCSSERSAAAVTLRATVADRMRPARPRLVRPKRCRLTAAAAAGVLIYACALHSGGELLKLVDVSAGLVAAKHARGPCLTISVDRVIFLQEIRVGDVISISSAVNRAWGR